MNYYQSVVSLNIPLTNCGKNKKSGTSGQPSVSLMLLPHSSLFCNLLLYRPMATWDTSALYDKK